MADVRLTVLLVSCVVFSGCGGKLDPGSLPPDSGVPHDEEEGGMILEEGGLLEGKCQMVCNFKANGYDWAALTDSSAVTVADHPSPSTFDFNCAASGGSGFYYHLQTSVTDLSIGDHQVNGDMLININGRESETATGKCTVHVDSIGMVNGYVTPKGTYSCPELPVAYGKYEMHGPFEVPLPKQ